MRGSTAGITDGGYFKAPNRPYKRYLTFLDYLVSSLIVAPLVVGYWKSTWQLVTIYIYPNSYLYTGIVSSVIGLGGQLCFTHFQETFRRNFHPSKNRVTYYVFSRFYTYVYGFVCVNNWRGIWFLHWHYIFPNEANIKWVTMVALLLIVVLRGSRNIMASPFALQVDQPRDYFAVRTMFQKVVRKERS